MSIRVTGAFALHLLLVLTSLLEAAGHDHPSTRDHEVRPCVVDHSAPNDGQEPSSVPRLASSAQPHEHECLGCRLGGQRLSLSAPASASHSLLIVGASPVQNASAPTLSLHSGRTSRGPPAS